MNRLLPVQSKMGQMPYHREKIIFHREKIIFRNNLSIKTWDIPIEFCRTLKDASN